MRNLGVLFNLIFYSDFYVTLIFEFLTFFYFNYFFLLFESFKCIYTFILACDPFLNDLYVN